MGVRRPSRAAALVGRGKWESGHICSGIGNDPGRGPVDGTGRAGTGAAVMFFSSKSGRDPGAQP